LERRSRYHIYYTPANASWLNQVERWFGLITQQAIRRGSFKSLPDLVGLIKPYTEQDNLTAQPFPWTATAYSMLTKLERLCGAVIGTGHSDQIQIQSGFGTCLRDWPAR
jgi:hypothetical protein